jgi:hypothetical protein
MGNFWKNALSGKAAWDLTTAPLRKREGQPFLQGTARNIAHASFGDDFANKFEQKHLGDFEGGSRYPTGGPASAPVGGTTGGQVAGGFASLSDINPQAAAQAVPGTTAPGGGAGQSNRPELDEMLRRIAMSMGQGGGSGGMMLQPSV